MIMTLENNNAAVAKAIYSVFQSSYAIEAALIGCDNFPPLQRSVTNILQSSTEFIGYLEQEELAAVVEISLNGGELEIHSVTVAPNFFRRGIADALLSHLISEYQWNAAIVETAEVNTPAIELYKKHGFIEVKYFMPSHGIPKVALKAER